MFCYNQTTKQFVTTINSDGNKYLAYKRSNGALGCDKACYFRATKDDSSVQMARDCTFSRRLLQGRRSCTPVIKDFWDQEFINN